jgi:hypothetical protein
MAATEVEMLTTVVTSQYGTLTAKSVLRTSEEFAAHLVNDLKCAKYCAAPEPAEPPPVAEEHPEPARRTLFKKRK